MTKPKTTTRTESKWPLPTIPENSWRRGFDAVRQTYIDRMTNGLTPENELWHWRQMILSLNEIEHELKKALVNELNPPDNSEN